MNKDVHVTKALIVIRATFTMKIGWIQDSKLAENIPASRTALITNSTRRILLEPVTKQPREPGYGEAGATKKNEQTAVIESYRHTFQGV